MPRYESGKGKDRRFWEVVIEGSTLYTRYGVVGKNGRMSQPKTFTSAEAAQREAEKRCAEKQKSGFERVDDDVGGQLRNPEFIAAILANPDDAGPYLVYGDWLQSQGDVRGALIAVQHQLETRPDDATLEKQEKHLLKKLAPARVAQMAKKKRNPKKAASGYTELAWRLGFITGARIGRNSDRPPYTVRELVAALLAHPSAQVLRSLTIGALGPGDGYDYSLVVEEICRAAPGSLRELFLADFAAEHSELAASTLGDVSGLYRALPGLEKLHLRGGTMDLGNAMDLPGLRVLALTTTLFDDRALQAVAAASWPTLKRLELRAGGTTLPGQGTVALLAAGSMKSLVHLGLMDIGESGDIVRNALLGSELLRRLHVLDLSGGSLTDSDADSILAQRHEFAHLQRLHLEGNYLTERATAALRGVCADVRVDNQRPPALEHFTRSDQEIMEFAQEDARSMTAARKLLKPAKWPDLGREGNILWGRCQGSELYDVSVDMDTMEAGCTCPSMKYPCKHAIGLVLMAQSHPIPPEPPPPGFVETCEAHRYDPAWG